MCLSRGPDVCHHHAAAVGADGLRLCRLVQARTVRRVTVNTFVFDCIITRIYKRLYSKQCIDTLRHSHYGFSLASSSSLFYLFLLILVPIILADASRLKTHAIGSSADALAFGEVGGLILTTWLIGFVYYALGMCLRYVSGSQLPSDHGAIFQFAVLFSIQKELFWVEFRRYFSRKHVV